jgi:hypothetical protein
MTMQQHQKTLDERPLDAHGINIQMRTMKARGVPLVDIIESVEAGVATFLQEQGVDPSLAFTDDDEIAVTILVSGEVATDALPHMLPKAAA